MKHYRTWLTSPTRCSRSILPQLAFITLCWCSVSNATDLAVTKLQGRWPVAQVPTKYQEGGVVALSDKWALSSAPAAPIGGSSVGAVQVYSAQTGAWLRLLSPPAPMVSNTLFGTSLAISGDLALIGARGANSDRGAVFIYNLSTGQFVRALIAADGLAGDRFGVSIAVGSGKVIVGAPYDEVDEGSAYLFDLATGVQLNKFTAPAAAGLDTFGISVAIEGNIALIGMPGRSNHRGAACAFDLSTYALLKTIVPASSVAGNLVGQSVALSQGIAIMAAPNRSSAQGAIFLHELRTGSEQMLIANDGAAGDLLGHSALAADAGMVVAGALLASSGAGAAYVFDLKSGQQKLKFMPADTAPNSLFGEALALSGNTALIGRPGDDLPTKDRGSAYLIKPLTTAMPMTLVTAKNSTAPGSPETTFGVLGDAFINNDGEVAFGAKLSGAGSHGGTDTGVWTGLRTGQDLSLSNKSNDFIAARQLLSMGTPLVNQDVSALYPATLKIGVGGVTASNNKLIIAEITDDSFIVLQTGQTVVPFGASTFLGFTELVQSNDSGHDRWAATCTLKQSAATNTNATNDTCLYIHENYVSTSGRREGNGYVPDVSLAFGQFTGRVAFNLSSIVYSTATVGPAGTGSVIVQELINTNVLEVARRGASAPLVSGATFSAFLGETADPSERVLYRASVTGTGITTANNEGLWTRTTAGVDGLALRKGYHADLPFGITIAKIVQYWAIDFTGSKVLALVQLKGTGITAVNDQALVLVQEDNSLVILMREGQAAQGCFPATIGIISRVEVDPYQGFYAVLTTLVGATTKSDQALFTGNVYYGNSTNLATLRRPNLLLRKGELYDNQPSRIKSMSLPIGNVTASGAGGTGRGRAISWDGDFVLTVEFENGVRQIMKGALE